MHAARTPWGDQRPLVDTTQCSTTLFRVGVPCGPGYGQGRLYTAIPGPDGRHVITDGLQPVDEANARLLRSVLEGPRKVGVEIWHRDDRTTASTLLTAYEVLLEPAAHPHLHDYKAWSLWTQDTARTWLADCRPDGLPPGGFAAYAIAPDIAQCAGPAGFHGLSNCVKITP